MQWRRRRQQQQTSDEAYVRKAVMLTAKTEKFSELENEFKEDVQASFPAQ
jgi:hypothetical protein